MIVPMSHITVLCLESDKPQTLARLAELGVLHVVTRVSETGAIAAAQRAGGEARRALAVVKTAVADEPLQLALRPGTPVREEDRSLAAEINRLADRYAGLREAADERAQEIERHAPWGDFDPDAWAALNEAGVPVFLFTAKLSEDVPDVPNGVLEVIRSDKDGVYGIVAGVELPDCLTAFPPPRKRLSVLKEEHHALLASLAEIAESLASHADAIDALEAEQARREEDGEYVTVFENMPASGTIAHIEGFLDERKTGTVVSVAADNGWGVALREPRAEENPPTLLEPPRLFRPIVALFRGLGITPGYHEADVSVPFFIFFSIFFAMLIGDAGYGALILLFTAIGWNQARKRAKGALSTSARSMITLFAVFGLGTIAYGVLSGTYFGIEKAMLPESLRFQSVAFLEDQNNIMQLCFTLGALHLSLARLWNAIVLFPSKKFLAEVGWVGVVWSMYLVICGIVIAGFDYPSWGTPMMVVSILMIVLFMLDVSELREHGVSLGMLPLNIVSSMGDIISYVRLFAVGLATVKVAENFNMMALELDLPMVFKLPAMILILVLGHGLNLVMGALGILVHAVRLNTLEFSGAKGITWSGHPFKPFKARAREALRAVDQE